MTSDDFYTAVRDHLRGRNPQALIDLRDLLDSGLRPEDLGDPADYAAMVSDTDTPRSSAYGRVWDPTNPNIFVRRVVGIGWDANLAAIAVKLGWMRPDDLDADVLDAAPESAMRVTTALPLLGAGIAVAASAVAAVRADGRLPSGWDIGFRPDRYTGRVRALAPGVVMSVGSALWASRFTDRGDRLSRGVYASSLSFLGAGVSVLTARSTYRGELAQPGLGVVCLVVAPTAASLVAGLVPIRQGLRATWKEAGLRG